MKHLLLLLCLTFISLSAFAQKKENLFFEQNGASVTFYLNEVGDITTKSRASYYRVVHIDTLTFTHLDSICDYFISGQKAWVAQIRNGQLSGSVKSFYKNGKLKYEGSYREAARHGSWTYYYKNGKPEKTLLYKDGSGFVQKVYKKNGKELISDGNGDYTGTVLIGYKTLLEGLLQGKLVNGRMDGAWRATGHFGEAIDYFENGTFVKSETWGIDFPVKRIIYDITGYDLHENVVLVKFNAASDRYNNKISEIYTHLSLSDPGNRPLQYGNSMNLNHEFRSELSALLLQLIEEKQLRSFQTMLQFTVTEENKVENAALISNNEQVYKALKEFIVNSGSFIAPVDDYSVRECCVYICILFTDKQLLIPTYQYNGIKFE